MPRLHLAFVPLAAALVACSSGATTTSSPTSSSSSSSSTSGAPEGGAQCFGKAQSPRDWRDQASCFLQHGYWNNYGVNGDSYCEQRGFECNHVDLAGYQGNEAAARAACIQVIGCSWRGADGEAVENPAFNGRCEGTAVPCEDIRDMAVCDKQLSCVKKTSSSSGIESCERRYSVETHPSECSEMQGTGGSLHPQRSKEYCETRSGCTWHPPR